MLLCTAAMTPKDNNIKSVVCFCHGYSDSMFPKRNDLQRLTDAGFAVIMIEYEGHGRSDGPLALIPSWEYLIDDVSSFFKETVTTNSLLKGKRIFLMGESLGGAVAHSVYSRMPNLFQGVIFISPMCKISDDLLPSKFFIDTLRWLTGPTGTSSFFGYLPIAPSKRNMHDLTFRIKENATFCRSVPTFISFREARLTTARELLDATQRISQNLGNFDAPFLVLHGKDDRVTDPLLSQALHDESKSMDKSIKLYDRLWHVIISCETEENMNMIYSDITEWILKRS
jgi:acylglycerol lipase